MSKKISIYDMQFLLIGILTPTPPPPSTTQATPISKKMFIDESPKYSPDDIEVLICMCFNFVLVSISKYIFWCLIPNNTHTCISWYNEKHTHTTPSQKHILYPIGPFPEEVV